MVINSIRILSDFCARVPTTKRNWPPPFAPWWEFTAIIGSLCYNPDLSHFVPLYASPNAQKHIHSRTRVKQKKIKPITALFVSDTVRQEHFFYNVSYLQRDEDEEGEEERMLEAEFHIFKLKPRPTRSAEPIPPHQLQVEYMCTH